MATYFLEHSPSYRINTSKEVFRRREIICRYLTEDYRTENGTEAEIYQKVKEALAKEGIPINSFATYQADKAILRKAYLWLIASTPAEKNKILESEKSTFRLRGAHCLNNDGITMWEQVKDLEPLNCHQNGNGHINPPHTSYVSEIAEENPNNNSSTESDEIVAEMQETLEALAQENEELKLTVASLTESLEAAKEEATSWIQYVEKENTILEERLLAAEIEIKAAHSQSLEKIAQTHPHLPELFKVAQKLRESQTRNESERDQLLASLPKSFQWQNEKGPITYQSQFLKAVLKLNPQEREQMIKGVKLLITEGYNYSSLQTARMQMAIPHSPEGCFVSRSTYHLRFSWHKKDALIICFAYRKGESRLREHE